MKNELTRNWRREIDLELRFMAKTFRYWEEPNRSGRTKNQIPRTKSIQAWNLVLGSWFFPKGGIWFFYFGGLSFSK
jgi:hypothetical protein